MQIITDKKSLHTRSGCSVRHIMYYIIVSVPVHCAFDCVYYFTVPVQCAFDCVYYITVSVPV